jgi:hypothetical protein
MKSVVFTLAAILMTLPATAFSSVKTPDAVKISFDDLRSACQNPSSFHNQNAPSNIQISCHNLSYKWVPATDGLISMAIPRDVTASVYSDKYVVGSVTAPVMSPSQDMACPRFKQVSETVETVVAVTCDEILAFKGDLTSFCTAALDNLTKSNPAAVILADTDRTIDTCQEQSKPEQKPVKVCDKDKCN